MGGVRTVVRHPVKATGRILGHKLEVIYGQHTRKRNNPVPPKIPKHPMQDVDQNMNELVTYNDLKIRWQWTTRHRDSRMNIARKWKPQRCDHPAKKPTCAFIWHRQMPHREPMPEMPAENELPNVSTKHAFAVFKSSPIHQHKVTVGDLVQCEKLNCREAGEKVVFGTVLLVGSRDYTIIGKPVVPYAKVKATIEQQTLSGEVLSFTYKPRKKQSRFLRCRAYLTMVRIDEISLTPEEDHTDPPLPKPLRLMELWSNRWLDPAEKEPIEMVWPEGQRVEGAIAEPVPKVAELYDGAEHQPGSYHRRGLTSCYRFWPDPQKTHWGNQ